MRYIRAFGAVVAVAALVVPASASAHPSVYTGEAVIDTNPAEGVFAPAPQTRHMVTNHGNTVVLRETNGESADGVISYALVPGDHPARGTAAALDPPPTGGDTGAQPHATCRPSAGPQPVDALWTDDAIMSWQGEDPFYGYIPFQKARAKLDDTPISDDPEVADWIDDVQTLTGVDLSTVSDDPAVAATQLSDRCSDIGGEFIPADETQTTAASLAAGQVEPLEEEITALKADLAAAQAAAVAAEQARAAAQAAGDAARAQLASVMPGLTPLAVTMPSAQLAARRLARNGTTLAVTGPPLQSVTVRLTVAKSRVKKLGLDSRVLVSKTVALAADGTAQVALKPKGAVGKVLKKMRNNVSVTAEALSNDRASARGTLTG
jgi:hypothetical protein